MGIDVSQNKEIGRTKKSLIGKMSSRVFKVLDWLAKGQAGNQPCKG